MVDADKRMEERRVKIVVAAKRVVDYNVKTSMNPFDAIERVPEVIDAI